MIISDSDDQLGDMINMRGDFGNRIEFFKDMTLKLRPEWF